MAARAAGFYAAYSGDAVNAGSTSAAVSVGVYSETISYFHNDAEGTPLASTDAAGNLLWSESYRAYGDPVQTPLDGNNNLWYTGKSYDTATQLSYLGARYYDPVLGRFMGVDPLDFREQNMQSFNRYAYANNNPNMFVDPDGRDTTVSFVDPSIAAKGKKVVDTQVPRDSPAGMAAAFALGSETVTSGDHTVQIFGDVTHTNGVDKVTGNADHSQFVFGVTLKVPMDSSNSGSTGGNGAGFSPGNDQVGGATSGQGGTSSSATGSVMFKNQGQPDTPVQDPRTINPLAAPGTGGTDASR